MSEEIVDPKREANMKKHHELILDILQSGGVGTVMTREDVESLITSKLETYRNDSDFLIYLAAKIYSSYSELMAIIAGGAVVEDNDMVAGPVNLPKYDA